MASASAILGNELSQLEWIGVDTDNPPFPSQHLFLSLDAFFKDSQLWILFYFFNLFRPPMG